jgi:hypothetical protein
MDKKDSKWDVNDKLAWTVAGLLVILFVGYITIELLRPRDLRTHNTIVALKEIVEAQNSYHKKDWNGDGVFEYASTLKELADKELLTSQVAASEEKDHYYSGHRFHLITHLKKSPLGLVDYFENGRLTNGYVVVALQAEWDCGPFRHFMITNTGVIYEGDNGSMEGGLKDSDFSYMKPYKER